MTKSKGLFLITALILAVVNANGNQIAPGLNIKTYLKYYEDGIYDTIKQIKKDAEEGLSEYPLDEQIKGKIVVCIDSEGMSVTDIVRIKTVAIKNNYTDSVTATNLETNKHYIVFDSFDREADADYTIKRLKEYGVYARKIYGGKWVKNPIVIKKIANDLKTGLLANMPVKVVEVERVVFKNKEEPEETVLPEIGINEKSAKSIKAKITKTRINELNKTDKAKERKLLLKRLIIRIKRRAKFSFKNKSFTYKGKEYKLGDKIEGFTITRAYIKKVKCGEKLVFRFNNYSSNHMTITRCINSGKKELSSNKGKVVTAKDLNKTIKSSTANRGVLKSNNTKTIADKNDYYFCDFRKIRALYIPEEKRIKKIEDTDYSFLFSRTEKVLFVNEGKEYMFFKQSGLKPVGIKKGAWREICQKN